jgi:hypothetical protein
MFESGEVIERYRTVIAESAQQARFEAEMSNPGFTVLYCRKMKQNGFTLWRVRLRKDK